MKGKKPYLLIFFRTLAAFIVFWLLMVIVLTVNNKERMKEKLSDDYDGLNSATTLNLERVVKGEAPAEERFGTLTQWLIQSAANNGTSLGITRVYDDAGNELARSPLSLAWFTKEGMGSTDGYVLFDAVLTDAEQIALADRLREELDGLWYFVGTESGVINVRDGWKNVGLYGEVTGILEHDVIYPQKLILYFEDHTVVLADSDHEMFDGAELTTIQFNHLQGFSVLSSAYGSAEDLLALYKQANALVDDSLGSGHLAKNKGVTRYAANGRCVVGADAYTEVLMARAYVYIPWKIYTYGLWFAYGATFLAALMVAIWVSRMQIKTLKKERQLTRSIAHELKTPAAVLRAYAESLSEDAVPEKRQEYLAAIVEESDRMAVLVNELLDLSRMEGSAGVLVKESVNLTALVRDGFERLRAPMWERALALVLNLEPITLEGDPKRLGQVVDNLAVNALNHASEGGVYVTLKREGERAVLCMRNNCQPILNEALNRLWEPFYKVDESRSDEGSGLGLAVVKNIVELHGGACRAESLPDGIRFVVELPC